MTHEPAASVIISSYNHSRFLAAAIDSALAQTYAPLEVVVVDDGSTDHSRQIIAGYGNGVVAIFKDNGGMGSAINAGFHASRGDVVIFLDADDILLPTALEKAVPACLERGVSKVQWPLWTIDEDGHSTGATYPAEPLSEGNLLECVLERGEEGYVWPVTSGNAWPRTFLERVLPMPEEEYRGCGESYLTTLAPAFGTVRALPEPLGNYRLHAQSLSNRRTIRDMMAVTQRRHRALERAFRRFGFSPEIESWPPDASTRERISTLCARLEGLLPPKARFMFVEWDQWGPGRMVPDAEAIPFMERNGRYWGRPIDDVAAVEELERQRLAGATFIVFAWPALWWLDYYRAFRGHLHSRYTCVVEDEDLVVFSLRGAATDWHEPFSTAGQCP